jgi:uncharacterized RDD family membrane protein YckC
MIKITSYATFYERLLARLIDSLVYFMVIFVPIVKISSSTDFTVLLNSIYNFTIFVLFIAFIILPFEVFMTAKFKGTPGKLLMGLKIQKEDGKPLSYQEAFIRLTIGRAVSGLFFGLGYLWIFKNEKRQAWHDLINQSIVIKRLSFEWLIGILILIAFLLINMSLFAETIVKFISNAQFFQSLIY